MFVDPITTATVLVWAFEHLHIPAILIGVWKLSSFFADMKSQTTKTISQIDTLATNHFPHLQESAHRQDALLQSMDGSLKTLANQVKRVRRKSPARRKK
jgi:hypothetical protein